MKLVTDEGPLFSPVRGRHYQFDRFNTTYREIYLDANDPAPFLPYLLIYPFQRVHRFEFSWKTLMTEDEAQAKGLRPILTYVKNTKELSEGDDRVEVQKLCVVKRSVKDQYYLLDREVHPFILDILSSDSVGVKLIFTFTLKIVEMNQILSDFPAGNFLAYAENLIVSELGCILRGLKFEELRGVAHGGIQQEIEDMKEKVNKEFAKHRFTLLRVMNEAVMILPESAKLILEQQNIALEKAKKEQLEISSKAKAAAEIITGNAQTIVLTKRAKDVGNAETEVLTKRTKEVGEIEADVLGQKLYELAGYQRTNKSNIDLTKVGIAEKLGNLSTLVSNNVFGDDSKFEEILTAELVAKKSQGGGQNAN